MELHSCSKCNKYFDKQLFLKKDKVNFYKTCEYCRKKSRDEGKKRNKDQRKIIAHNYYINNKEKILSHNKLYRINNPEIIRLSRSKPHRQEVSRKWKKEARRIDPCKFIWYAAKRRAKINNLSFSITQEDIRNIYPIDNKCPMLKIEFCINNKTSKDNSPSLDRIVPELGYIKENILIISHKANRIKNNSTLADLEKIVQFLKSL